MKTFKDKEGRSWEIELTLGSAMAVKAKLGVDLLQPESGDPPLLTRLGTDEMLLAEVICCLISDQFEKHSIDDVGVRGAFDGATLLGAQRAFYEELIDFFRSRGRTDRAVAAEKQARMIEASIAAVTTRLEGVDVEAEIRGVMSGISPGSSVLTPVL